MQGPNSGQWKMAEAKEYPGLLAEALVTEFKKEVPRSKGGGSLREVLLDP